MSIELRALGCVSMVFASMGCVASPVAPAGFVDLRAPEPGAVDLGTDAHGLGIQSLGWSGGGTFRATPHLRERWALPIEAGAFGTITRNGWSHGHLRLGVRYRLRPWLSLGGGLSGNAVLHDERIGVGGGGDLELVLGRSFGRFGLSAAIRPGVAANPLTVTTLWMPSTVAFAWHVTPRIALFGSVFVAGGLSVVGPFGALVGGAGAGVGISGRLGPRPPRR